MLTVDPEIQSLIPPLSPDERAQLEANIVRDGCIDPILTWKGTDTILDGHNRHDICERRGLGYQTREIELADRSAVVEWVIRHQFGRRNLSDFARAELALKLKPIVAAVSEQREKSGKKSDSNPTQNSAEGTRHDRETDTVVAKAADVSKDTLRKVEKIKGKGSKKLQDAARQGKISINAANKAADLPAEQQDAIAEADKKPSAKSIGKAAATLVQSEASEPNDDPAAAYNAALGEHAKAAESLARAITQTAEFDKGHNAQNDFAKGHLYHDATVGLIRKVKRTLEEKQIAGKRGDRYITKAESEHTARVAASRKAGD